MIERNIICQHYTCADGPCEKRGVNVTHAKNCQHCKFYTPRRHGVPVKPNTKKQRMDRIERKEREY